MLLQIDAADPHRSMLMTDDLRLPRWGIEPWPSRLQEVDFRSAISPPRHNDITRQHDDNMTMTITRCRGRLGGVATIFGLPRKQLVWGVTGLRRLLLPVGSLQPCGPPAVAGPAGPRYATGTTVPTMVTVMMMLKKITYITNELYK